MITDVMIHCLEYKMSENCKVKITIYLIFKKKKKSSKLSHLKSWHCKMFCLKNEVNIEQISKIDADSFLADELIH